MGMRETSLRIAETPELATLPRTAEEVRRSAILIKVADYAKQSGSFSVKEGARHQVYSIRELPSGNYILSPRNIPEGGSTTASNSLDSTDTLSFQRVYQERAASSVTITPEGRIVTPNLQDQELQSKHEMLIRKIDRALENRHEWLMSELIG